MSKSSDYWGNRLDAIAQNRFDKSYEETIEQIKKLYDDASENIKNEIETMVIKLAERGKLNRSDLYNFNRYISLQKTINNELTKVGGKEVKIFADLFDKEFLNVFNLTRQEMGPLKEFCLFNPTMAKNIINMPWFGENYSSRIWKNTSKLSRVLKDNIEKTLLLGSSRSHMYKSVMDELKDTVDGDMQKAYKNADRLIRTELMHTINESQRYCYKEAGYTKLEWLAYFDERTCDECASLNGTILPIDSKDVPPIHPNDRCTMIPVLESIKDIENHNDYDIIKLQNEVDRIGIKGKVIKPPSLDISKLKFDNNHINSERLHGVSFKQAIKYITEALVVLERWNGKVNCYYAKDGASYVNVDEGLIRTSFTNAQFDVKTKILLEVIEDYGE